MDMKYAHILLVAYFISILFIVEAKLTMAFKDVYVPYLDFWADVLANETGIIELMARDYCLKRSQQLPGYPKKEYYLPKYPFRDSFTAHCIDSQIHAIRDKYDEYLEANKCIINENTELPIFGINHTFENFFQSRLENLLDGILDDDNYKKYADFIVVGNQDRQRYYIYDPSVHSFIARPHYNDLFNTVIVGASSIFLYNKKTTESINLGDCDSDQVEKLLSDINDKLKAGETTIYPFEWIDY